MARSQLLDLCFSLIPYLTNPEPGGSEWKMDPTRQIVQSLTNGAYLYFPITLHPGSIMTDVGVRWGAEAETDGLYVTLMRREAEGTSKYFSALTGVITLRRGSGEPDQWFEWMGWGTWTIEEGYSYVIKFVSDVLATGTNIYDLKLRTRARLL